MKLDEYIERDKTETNLFWILQSGEHQNLLDESIMRIAELEKALEAVKNAESKGQARRIAMQALR